MKMALLSTLRYGSTAAQPTGSGNYGGDLHLFFTKLNANDLKQSGTLTWAGWNIADTYNLPNGAVTLGLKVVSDGGAPLFLVMIGDISVKTSAGKSLGGALIGEGGAAFTPGTPATTLFNGSQSGTVSGVTFAFGFELMVAWDGVSADCHGSWWTTWH
jgi:hypothetical protein